MSDSSHARAPGWSPLNFPERDWEHGPLRTITWCYRIGAGGFIGTSCTTVQRVPDDATRDDLARRYLGPRLDRLWSALNNDAADPAAVLPAYQAATLERVVLGPIVPELPAPSLATRADPFAADHPDNVPAFDDRIAGLVDSKNTDAWQHSMAEWDEIIADAWRYLDEVGSFERRPGYRCIRLPVGYLDWEEVRRHPCWADYRDQMGTVPPGTAAGFDAWFNGTVIAGVRYGPARPFLAHQWTRLPAGWRLDDPPPPVGYRVLAFDPARHLVTRRHQSISASTVSRMAEAGFDTIVSRDDRGVHLTYFVRDRAADRGSARPVPRASRALDR